MSVISFTELVAWYGAVLAPFVACFELWKWIHSRALLKVTTRFAQVALLLAII